MSEGRKKNPPGSFEDHEGTAESQQGLRGTDSMTFCAFLPEQGLLLTGVFCDFMKYEGLHVGMGGQPQTRKKR